MGTQRGVGGVAAAVVALALAVSAVATSRFQPAPASAVALRSEVAAPALTVPPTTAPSVVGLSDRPEPLGSDAPDLSVRPDPQPSTGRLRFVYFIELDEEFDQESVARIERQAEALQQFWFDQFGGTFFLPQSGVDVIYGEHTVDWYDTTAIGDDPRWYRLLNMQTEVREALQVTENDDVRMIVYPSARLDGRVGANRYHSAWMDGDDLTCIDGEIATVPYSSQFPANCLTTVAHELGHVYGLGHDGDDADCMQLGFYRYISGTAPCSFSEASRDAVRADLRNSGWLDALPGNRF